MNGNLSGLQPSSKVAVGAEWIQRRPEGFVQTSQEKQHETGDRCQNEGGRLRLGMTHRMTRGLEDQAACSV